VLGSPTAGGHQTEQAELQTGSPTIIVCLLLSDVCSLLSDVCGHQTEQTELETGLLLAAFYSLFFLCAVWCLQQNRFT
jgi:hypothetical protein